MAKIDVDNGIHTCHYVTYMGTRPSKTSLNGSSHHNWKGDNIKPASGRDRARKKFSLGNCEICQKKAIDRHHKDGNTLNNSQSNIQRLCRRCHMIEDGRLVRFKTVIRRSGGCFGQREKLPPTECVNCKTLSKPLRMGRCHKCNEFFRRNGIDWTQQLAIEGKAGYYRKCKICGRFSCSEHQKEAREEGLIQ